MDMHPQNRFYVTVDQLGLVAICPCQRQVAVWHLTYGIGNLTTGKPSISGVLKEAKKNWGLKARQDGGF